MRARRLGRLVGSLLALAALAGAIYADDHGTVARAGFDWTGYIDGTSIDAPATAVLPGDPTAPAAGDA